jgi:hypothetical protein
MNTKLSISFFVNRLALHIWQVLGRLLPPANLRINALPRFRSDAFFYLSLSRLGTITIPRDTLYDLGRLLDSQSYVGLLSRCRMSSQMQAARVSTNDAEVTVTFDYFSPASQREIHAPYFLHPTFYADGTFRRMGSSAGSANRPIRLVFAGTCDRATYTSNFPFKILDRTTVIEYVADTFRELCHIATSRTEALRAPSSGRPIVLVITKRTEDSLEKHMLEPKNYLRILSDSEFAICPPGCHMPHSHNIIEAIMQGSIPVTNYADQLHPSLHTGVNCFGFSTLTELNTAIRNVLDVSSEKIKDMRVSLLSYARNWLTVERFALQLKKQGTPLVIRVNGESVSVRLHLNR